MLRAFLTSTSLAVLLAACATQGHPQQTASAADAKRECLSSTGSRVAHESQTPCRSYTGQDLQSTGEFNAGDALQRLDPAVTVQHH
jgi:hypothetical protein